jgi:hypothetical protein
MREDLAKTTQTVLRTRFDVLKTRSAEVTMRHALLTGISDRRSLMDSATIVLRVSTAAGEAG